MSDARPLIVHAFGQDDHPGVPIAVFVDAPDASIRAREALAAAAPAQEAVFLDGQGETVTPARLQAFSHGRAVARPSMAALLAGAAAWRGSRDAGATVAFETGPGGRVEVVHDEGAWWVTSPAMEFLNPAQPAFAARSLRVEADAVEWRQAPQAVAVGGDRIVFVVPLVSGDFLRAARVDVERFRRLLPRVGGDSIVAFTRDAEAGAWLARCLPAVEGATDVAADGEAAAALAAWLAQAGDVDARDGEVTIRMGVKTSAPWTVRVRGVTHDGAWRARVGGRMRV